MATVVRSRHTTRVTFLQLSADGATSNRTEELDGYFKNPNRVRNKVAELYGTNTIVTGFEPVKTTYSMDETEFFRLAERGGETPLSTATNNNNNDNNK